MKKTENAPVLTRRSGITTRKIVLTGLFTCLAFVLNTFVYFPAMAPFQHFVNVLAAVFVGPWYGSAAGFLTGVLRMACGRDVGSVTGAMFGPILGGLLYRKFGTWWSVYIGEVIGTGVVGAMASYPLFRLFYGLDAQSPFYFIPFYIPSAAVGAAMGVAVLLILTRTGTLERMLHQLNR